jgi:signal transduction histidine kinase
VAQQAAIAIHNARLYEQAVVKAEESAALYEAGQAVTQSLDLDATLGQIVGSARRLAGADRAFVWLVDPADGSLRAGTASGQGSESFRGVRLPAESPAAAARAAREARPLTVENALDPTVADPALSARFNNAALLAIPFHVQATIVGVLVCGYNAPRTFAPAEVDRLAGLAHQAAIAIHNARLFADLQAAYQQLKAAQEQAVQVEKLRALGEMAGGVAHDFNNLLTAILGRAQLLRATLRDPRAAESLDIIERAALDGAETVRRILGFARARGPEQMESVEVAPLLGQVAEVTRPRWKDQAQSRGADIAIQIAAEPVPPVRANPAELREVLVNLVFNAVDALAGGGTITLGARLRRARAAQADGGKDVVEIFVRDTGVGMPEEVRQRAFDPFFTTKGVKGTGLGLSVVYGIISRHGGTVEIQSRQGHGTTVTVHLPAAGTASRETAAPIPAPAARARILVLDDEQALAHLLAEILRIQGHAVEAVTSPREALDRLQAEGADLLFTDLGMPDLSGWEMAARARELCPGLRVVLVTGWGHQLDPAEVEASGVAGIVAKPYRMEDIREAVAAALRPQPQPA